MAVPGAMTPACLDQATLEAFHLGKLPDEALEAVLAHVADCRPCGIALDEAQQRLQRSDNLLAQLRQCDGARGASAEAGCAELLRAVRALPLSGSRVLTGDATLGEAEPHDVPAQLGRYRIVRKLGAGTFGAVFLGKDEELRREVAIKVPHRRRHAADADLYLAEVRALAALDHPGIVPVYDVGRTGEGLCYIVSKYVRGTNLANRLAHGPLGARASAELVAQIAAALHHAHQCGLTHRDVKPANILLDMEGRPYVADFGLALRDEDYGKGPNMAGTPAYMSPEQARGEGHRVDGRTDVFSLGVILYEMLAGLRPFRGQRVAEVLEQVKTLEVRPPRQLDPSVPRELDRICLKCLAKRSADRYSTALDLAEDLRHWLGTSASAGAKVVVSGTSAAPAAAGSGTLSNAASASNEHVAARVLPKGLRSFDAADADFFLELLPGPRDRDGLPESLRFWKNRVEETDADRTFPVGLLYGPSGCGKSSLVKAGLLPRLAGHVTAVYIEATAVDSEARLLRGLRKLLPELPADIGLVEALATLRRGHHLAPQHKVLLVIDQFEQWLHMRHPAEAELVQALRQCDGGRVQALVMVRDDFWMAATRFMRDLEAPLREGHNSAAVDLFDLRHARKVLAVFGRAYGSLPERSADLIAEQAQFLEQAVASLAQDDKVNSVRLALFADMMKSRPWTPAALRAVGGAEGLGVTFLADTFSAATAPPEHRYHNDAARAVLQALLPPRGSDIRGQVRSEPELRRRAGYEQRGGDWQRLLHILDAELRLVTPTDPEGASDDACCYQLTHDFLVPALREWLTRQERATARGRAELCLRERAAAWAAQPESRQLPSVAEWLRIHLLARRGDWSPTQRTMMQRANRFYGLQLGALVGAVLVVGWLVGDAIGSLRGAALVRALAVAETADVPKLVSEIGPYRRWANPRLAAMAAAHEPASKERLHAAVALMPVDSSQADYLAGRLLNAGPDEVAVIRDALSSEGPAVTERLWQVLAEKPGSAGRRLRAAAALAALDPQHGRWQEHVDDVAAALVRENALLAGKWAAVLRPVRQRLVEPLAAVFREPGLTAAERTLAANLLADYAAERPALLADVLVDAPADAFAALYPPLAAQRDAGIPLLTAELTRRSVSTWRDARPDPAWLEPSLPQRQALEADHGMLTEHFAFCHGLPPESFAALAAALRDCGYRPTRVRPYTQGGAVRVAAVWTRDGGDFHLGHGLSADEVQQQDAERQAKGQQLVDLAGYLAQDGERYACIWAPGAERTQAYIGVPLVRRPPWKEAADAKLGPISMHAFLGRDGKPRCSTLWRAGTVPGICSCGDDAGTHEARGLYDGLPVDVGLTPLSAAALAAPDEWRFAGCFLRMADFEHVHLLGVPVDEHGRRGRELCAEGYRPAALAVASAGSEGRAAAVWHRPLVSDDVKDRLAKRGAGAAAALLRLGRAAPVWPLLRHAPDPRLRSYLIERLAPLGVSGQLLMRRFREEPDVSARRALLLALGDYGTQALPHAERSELMPVLTALYRAEPDPGLRAASGWLLRRWGQQTQLDGVDRELAQPDQGPGRLPQGGRRWYVNGEGQTMVIVPGPVEFVMGSPRGDEEREAGPSGQMEAQHRCRIERSFAIAAKEVTAAQFLRFRANHNYNTIYSPTPGHPVNGVTWYEAAEYCNWLSAQEGVPSDQWCYEPNADGKYAEGMKTRPDHLSLTGYRLPTEAEWEFACRAGSVTSRYYGETQELLPRYAWYSKNSLEKGFLEPGHLRPNDLGLFDMLGNAYEWCQDASAWYRVGKCGEPWRDQEQSADATGINDKAVRVMRGGSFALLTLFVRSSFRLRHPPSYRDIYNGVRPARTLAP